MGNLYECANKRNEESTKAKMIAGGNDEAQHDLFYGHMTIKLYSNFKGDKKLYLRTSDLQELDYDIYRKVVFPKFLPQFLEGGVEKMYKNLRNLAIDPDLLMDQLKKENASINYS